ncbi:hypothetical protein BG004_007219, partial [Podila humilis]
MEGHQDTHIHTQDHPFQRVSTTTTTAISPSPTRAYFPPSKTSSITPSLSATLTASLAATLASKKAFINHPSLQKVIAIHNSSANQDDDTNAPDYDETIASIPVLDLLPPPPVYDIVNCSTTQTLLLVSSLINTILAVNDRLACPKITLFHSRAIPNISIEAYLSRILQYAPFQNEVLLIILLYFDRIGGGCKPTQVLTNSIPKALLRQASMLPEQVSNMAKPKLEEDDTMSPLNSKISVDSDPMDEEEPIVDEIYTSSSESPVGSKLIINSFNIHRLLITSILVACKFSSDVFYPNVRYARVGGLPLSELNQLELEFLFLSQFELNTTESELQAYGNKLLMYHQRLNGTERAAFDSIGSPVKGEYPIIEEKKRTSIDFRIQQQLLQQQPQTQPLSSSQSTKSTSDQKQRPLSASFVASGPYRDSKEMPGDNDDDEVMSEKINDAIGSPRDWDFSDQVSPVIQNEPVPEKYPTHQRSNKMNLDHMIWPTNEMDTKYSASAHFGGMVRDEDAARIEEEFNKASPPPEQTEPNPKRKLQRLSSGTMDQTPSKRANTPGAVATSSTSKDVEKAATTPGNKNILRPLFKKIASFAHRSEAAPTPVPETSQPPALRSHPYLVRHRMSPPSSSTNVANTDENEDMMSPTSAAGHNPTPWQQKGYSPQLRDQNKSSGVMKPPPPPYSGQSVYENQERPAASVRAANANSRPRRQHRSREPSLSSLASELTFEPTRPSLSPMHEETNSTTITSASGTATMDPFTFPPRAPRAPQQTTQRNPQANFSEEVQSLNTPPATPFTKKSRPWMGEVHPQDLDAHSSGQNATRPPTSVNGDDQDTAMQSDGNDDETLVRRRISSQIHSRSATTETREVDHAMEAEMESTTSLRRGSTSSNASTHSQRSSQPRHPQQESQLQQQQHQHQGTAGRQWQPSRSQAPVMVQPVQYPHHYVASYYPSNIQLIPDAKGGYVQAFTTQAPSHHPHPPPQHYVHSSAGMVAIPRGMVPLQTAHGTFHHHQPSLTSPPASVASRGTRQFAAIRPRTPMTMDEEPKGHAAPPTAEASSSAPAAGGKKKKDTKSLASSRPAQQALRPLVPNVGGVAINSTSGSSTSLSTTAAPAPPPYRHSFVAYPSPYAHTHNPGGRPPPPPMLMAVEYHHSHHNGGGVGGGGGGGVVGGGPNSSGPHAIPPQFLATTNGPGGQHGPARLFIPIIPVVYNKAPTTAGGHPPPPPIPVSTKHLAKAAVATSKPTGLARIAPR